jgi:hypothetical protein
MDASDLEIVRDWAALGAGNLSVALSDEAFRKAARTQLAPLTADEFTTVAEGPVFEEFGPERAGVDGVIAGWTEMTGRYEQFHLDVQGINEIPGGRVFLPVSLAVRAQGGEERSVDGGAIFTLRDGLVTRLEMFGDRKQALKVAGMSTQEG